MHIGFDGTPLLGQRSGVGYYTSRLLTALANIHPDWDYWLYSNRPFNGLEAELCHTQKMVRLFPHSRWVWMQMILPFLVRQSGVDLCHFTNSLAPLWSRVPFVLTIHDASLFLYSQYHPRSRLLAMRSLIPLLARQASAVITVSEQSRTDLQQVLKVPAHKLFVIHEAAPHSFQPVTNTGQRARIRQKYHLPPRYILFVGTLEPRKNLHRLVRAFAKLHQKGYEHHLVLVGSFGWLMDRFLSEIHRLGIDKVVHYLGYVPLEELPTLFSCAELFAFPSLYEGFGLPLLEAMACGTPVLTSDRSATAEVCADAAWLVNPEDESAIGEGLAQLLNNPNQREQLRQKGLARAQQFSWHRAAQETAKVYDSVLGIARDPHYP